jgi:hypothetical protein
MKMADTFTLACDAGCHLLDLAKPLSVCFHTFLSLESTQ